MAPRRATSPGFRDQRYRDAVSLLAKRRSSLGLTQQELADRLGLHKQFISRVELGERRLDFVELVDYARALELDPIELIASVPQS